MPIDPSIIGQLRMPEPINPLAIRQQVEQLRLQQESQKALAEQRRAMAEQREAQTRELELQAKEDAALTALFSGEQMPAFGAIYRAVRPQRAALITKGIIDLQTAQIDSQEKFRKSALTRLAAIKAMPEPMRAQAYTVALEDYKRRGIDTSQLAPQYSPDVLDQYEAELLTPEQRVQRDRPINVPAGGVVLDPRTRQPIFTNPTKANTPDLGSFEDYVARKYGQNPTPEQIEDARKKYLQADDRAFRPPTPIVVMTGAGPQLVDRTSGQAREITGPDGKPVGLAPTTDERNRNTAVNRAQPVLASIAELSERINTQQGVIAKISGTAEKAKAQANLSDDVSEYDALVSGFTPMLARMVGHTGVLTEQDVQSVRKMLPQPTDSKSVRDRKIARINKILGGQGESASPDGPADLIWDPATGTFKRGGGR